MSDNINETAEAGIVLHPEGDALVVVQWCGMDPEAETTVSVEGDVLLVSQDGRVRVRAVAADEAWTANLAAVMRAPQLELVQVFEEGYALHASVRRDDHG